MAGRFLVKKDVEGSMVMAKKKDRVRREVEEEVAAGVTSLTIIQIIIQVGLLAQF